MSYQPRYQLICFVIVLLSAKLISSLDVDVYPDFNSTDCNPSTKNDTANNISIAFQSISNGSTLVLMEPGCYWLDRFSIIEGVSNVSIKSKGNNAKEYFVHCSKSVGIAFYQVKRLTIAGLTIYNCGITSGDVKNFSTKMKKTIDTFYNMSSEIGFAVIMADCADVLVKNLTITNTVGLGLVLVNVVGNSSFRGLTLLGNWAPICDFTNVTKVGSEGTIGGGMFILYSDYHSRNVTPNATLHVEEVYAHNNSFCQTLPRDGTATGNAIAHVMGSAGGIGIALAQLDYVVNVIVKSATFKNNTGWASSGAAITVHSGVKDSMVVFDTCFFLNNGYSDYNYRSSGFITTRHAGLFILKNADHPKLTVLRESDSKVLITNSVFDGNSAENCGNIDIVYTQPCLLLRNDGCSIAIINSSITNNQGSIGPAICASNSGGEVQFSEVCLELNNITVYNNKVHPRYGDQLQFSTVDSSGQVVLTSINVNFAVFTNFTDNAGVAIISVASNLYFSGSVLFHNNSGYYGGALQLLQKSHLVIENNTQVKFLKNSAVFNGGAIYIADLLAYAVLGDVDCFLYFNNIDQLCNLSSCPDISNLNISVHFSDNTALVGGTIYGTTLTDCPWYYYSITKNPKMKNVTTGLDLLASFADKFYFKPKFTNATVVSTDAASLTLKPAELKHKETITDYNTVYPGERLLYNAAAHDFFDFRASTLILSTSKNPIDVNSTLGDSIYWYIHSSDVNGSLVPVDVTGKENTSSVIYIFSTSSSGAGTISVTLRFCGLGFQYDNDSKQCICETNNSGNVTCDIKTQTITVPDNHWFGLVPQFNKLTVYTSCYYDYCKQGSRTFKPYNNDSQCNTGYYRTGVMCSECMEGKSTIFGSNRCWECSDRTLYWIPIFAVAGVFIIIVIAFLDISVADGCVTGFLFYCNCLNYFLLHVLPTPPTSYVFLPVSWMNLELGIESCFYSNMSNLSRFGLRLIFPTYLYMLMFLIVIVARYSTKFGKIPFSPSKTFATLFLLTFFSLFGTCVSLLGVSKLQAKNPVTKEVLTYYGWTGDISHQYGHGIHSALIVIAALLMATFLIPIPLLLLSPALINRFRYTYKFKPILDAFWNAYRPSCRFWFGVKSLFRIVAFTLAIYIDYPQNVFLFEISVLVLWFIQDRLSPYQSFYSNSFNSFLMLNLVVLLSGNIFADHFTHKDYTQSGEVNAFIYIPVLAVYAAFSVVVIVHLFKRFPCLRKNSYKLLKRLKREKSHSTETLDQSSNDEEHTDKYPATVTFTEFREPLIDGSINSGYNSIN